MRIVIIGAGHVGTNLQHAFELKHIHSELISSYDGPLLASVSKDEGRGEVFIYTVADHALQQVAAQVYAPHALHLHTSGTLPVEVFGPDKPHAGVMYFFQTFSKARLIDDWSGIPCFIEGHGIDDIAAIYSLAQNLTSRIYEADRHDRERLHVAGVFANNFSNLMYRMAEDILRDTQIPFQALLPLIDQTAAKMHSMHPAEAQTGPAQRHDDDVMAHHLEVLQTPPHTQVRFPMAEREEVYRLLSRLIDSHTDD